MVSHRCHNCKVSIQYVRFKPPCSSSECLGTKTAIIQSWLVFGRSSVLLYVMEIPKIIIKVIVNVEPNAMHCLPNVGTKAFSKTIFAAPVA